MKFLALVVALISVCGTSCLRADVGWEHKATVRVSTLKQPLVTLKMYNHWTPSRHRVLLKYDLSRVPGGLPPVPLPVAAGQDDSEPRLLSPAGGLSLIQRADEGRIIAYESQTRSYISEPLRPLLERLRFDPWRKIAPTLSREAPPELSEEQRTRLGAEVRAVLAPLRRYIQRFYFRELLNTRTFDGIPGRGYRLTQLINAGGMTSGQEQWVRVSFEWWLAGDLEGDDAIRQFAAASRQNLKGLVWPTTSMWLNEIFRLGPYLQDEQVQRAARTLMPPQSSPRAGFGGTPLRLYATVQLPPLQRSVAGDTRLEIALIRRETTAVPGSVFEAPADYKKTDIQPYLKKVDPFLNGEVIDRLYRGKPIDDLFSLIAR